MSTPKRLVIFFVTLIGLMQLVRFEQTNPVSHSDLEIKAEPNIKAILKKSCYDCHSNETTWPWYSKIAPVSWMISDHVEKGRMWLNFSEWEKYDQNKTEKLKKLIYREVGGGMPIPAYTLIHSDAKLSNGDRKALREWTNVDPSSVSMRD